MKHKIKILAIVLAGVLFSLAFVHSRSSSQTQTVTVETAGQKFKNIRVLNEMPAEQLGKVMNIMTASLGRDCKMCHVSNGSDFEKDDNEHKQVAREMFKMTAEINRVHFKGEQVVSCNTCHNGRPVPAAVPNLPAMVLPPRVVQPKDPPSVERIIASYRKAVGSADAFSKLRSLTLNGIRVEPDGKTTEPEDVTWHQGTMTVSTTYGTYVVTERSDGKTASKTGNGSPIKLQSDELAQIKREAQLFGVADLAKVYTTLKYIGVERIDGKEVYKIRAIPAEGPSEHLFLDIRSGLLIRRIATTPTVIGDFQFQVDYSDFKAIRGIKFPMTIRFAMPAIEWTRKVSNVKVQ